MITIKIQNLLLWLETPIEIAQSFHQVALKVFGETETNFSKSVAFRGKQKSREKNS